MKGVAYLGLQFPRSLRPGQRADESVHGGGVPYFVGAHAVGQPQAELGGDVVVDIQPLQGAARLAAAFKQCEI